MKNREIIKYVKEIREGNASGFEELYEAFLRLINFYGRKIGEDGSEELILFFTELLHSLDIGKFTPDESEELNKYIAVSIRNRYIELSRRKSRLLRISNEITEECADSTDEPDSKFFLKEGLMLLSERQRTVIDYRYFCGYSDREIADILSISRQGLLYLPILFIINATTDSAKLLALAQPITDYLATALAIILFVITCKKYFPKKSSIE